MNYQSIQMINNNDNDKNNNLFISLHLNQLTEYIEKKHLNENFNQLTIHILYNMIKNGENILNKYVFDENFKTFFKEEVSLFNVSYDMPLIFHAINHSNYRSNIEFIFYLFETNLWEDYIRRDRENNSIFEKILILFENIKKEEDGKILEDIIYEKYLPKIFKEYEENYSEFIEIYNGNTLFMNIVKSNNLRYIQFMMENILKIPYNNSHFSKRLKKNENCYYFLVQGHINKNDGESLLNLISKLNIQLCEKEFENILLKFIVEAFCEFNIKYMRNKDFSYINKKAQPPETPLINMCKSNLFDKLFNYIHINKNYDFFEIDCDFVDESGNNALMYALKKDFSELTIDFLYNNTQTIFSKNNEDETLLYLAYKNGIVDMGFYYLQKLQIKIKNI